MFAGGEQQEALEKQFKRYTSVEPTRDIRPFMVAMET
jgi:hypothetical protein